VIAAVTPVLDRHCSMFSVLGERFLQVRWHRPTPGGGRVRHRPTNTGAKYSLGDCRGGERCISRCFNYSSALTSPGWLI
jgi:hypothetical protein